MENYIGVSIYDGEEMAIHKAETFDGICNNGVELLRSVLHRYDPYSEEELDGLMEEVEETGSCYLTNDDSELDLLIEVILSITKKKDTDSFEIRYVDETDCDHTVTFTYSVFNMDKIPFVR